MDNLKEKNINLVNLLINKFDKLKIEITYGNINGDTSYCLFENSLYSIDIYKKYENIVNKYDLGLNLIINFKKLNKIINIPYFDYCHAISELYDLCDLKFNKNQFEIAYSELENQLKNLN
jgi:hypothetical protein